MLLGMVVDVMVAMEKIISVFLRPVASLLFAMVLDLP
jgi:hypothetical protein